jgi:exodeoxyribonuclease V beta subunit
MLADFPAGTRTGYLFHSIFEKTDFAAVDGPALPALVAEELPRHGFEPRLASVVERAVRAVCRAALDPGDPSLRLAALDRQAVRRELPSGRPADLSRHGPAAARALARLLRDHGDGAAAAYAARAETLSLPEVRGFLRGVMDLVFRHRGRWFVLDYKTNLLGATPEDYRPAALAAAMDAHHYRLQCCLYAVALRRYLAYRLADFDYQRDFGGAYYLFVRGMDEASPPGTGVVFDRPSLALLDALDGFFAGKTVREARP